MRFTDVLNEDIRGRNYTTKDTPLLVRRKQKRDLLMACGYKVNFDFPKDIFEVTKPDGSIINISDNTGDVEFLFKNEQVMDKWRKIYHNLFSTEGNKKTSHVNKDGSRVYGTPMQRYTAGDFIMKANLKSKILENTLTSYYDFIKDLASDVTVSFNK